MPTTITPELGGDVAAAAPAHDRPAHGPEACETASTAATRAWLGPCLVAMAVAWSASPVVVASAPWKGDDTAGGEPFVPVDVQRLGRHEESVPARSPIVRSDVPATPSGARAIEPAVAQGELSIGDEIATAAHPELSIGDEISTAAHPELSIGDEIATAAHPELSIGDGNGVARASAPASRARNQHPADPFRTLTSPDSGPHCMAGWSAADLARFFAAPIGRFQGGDYQRAHRLPDDRVLWTFQDAFIDGRLVHNAALLQSGRCFTILNPGVASWLLADATSNFHRWHWILDGAVLAGDQHVALFVVEMSETGPTYLSRTRAVGLRRVVLDATTLAVVSIRDEPIVGDDLYGWSVTADAEHTYLYSHCYQQFGFSGMFGFGPCVADVKVARVPRGHLDAPREYWDGTRWTTDAARAAPVVDGTFVMSGNNPAQIEFDGRRFLLVEKRDDWWGTTVELGSSDRATGPFARVASVAEPLACDRTVCNTYFASWVPWRQADGRYVWSISRNLWNGADTARNLERYRPTFASIAIAA